MCGAIKFGGTNTVYTFHSPLGIDETCNVIKATVESMHGKTREVYPGCIEAKWKTQPFHSKQFHTLFPVKHTFYVGDGLVRVDDGGGMMQMFAPQFEVRGHSAIWNAFVESLIKTAPDVDFGIKPGASELIAAQFVGDETEEVFVSKTIHSPSLSGAIFGGLLFGTPGAIIGSSYGTSRTTGKSSTQFSGTALMKGRYSNGLLIECVLPRNSPAYNFVLVNMSRYSDSEKITE